MANRLTEEDKQERTGLVKKFNRSRRGSDNRMKVMDEIKAFETRMLFEGKNG